MSNFDINISGGASIRLLTAGKYCDKDIVITAEDPGEGGVQLPPIEKENAATASDIAAGKQAIDADGNIVVGTLWREGGYAIEKEYSPNSGRVTLKANVGEPFIIDDGFVIGSVYVGDVEPNLKPENIVNNVTIAGVKGNYVGGVILPELTNPGVAAQLREGYQMIDENGDVVDGTLPDVTPVVTVSVDSNGYIRATATTAEDGVVAKGSVTGNKQLRLLAKSDVTVSGLHMTIPNGYYVANKLDLKVAVDTVEAATPYLTLNADTGVVTAKTAQASGYIESNSTKAATLKLPTQKGKLITPGTTEQLAVDEGLFTVGPVGVAGDANLVPENIAEGVSIFGVVGTHAGGGGVETVNVTFTIYGNGTIHYMGTEGVAELTSPYEQTVAVVKNSPVVVTHDDSTYLLNRGGSGHTVHYSTGGNMNGHSCEIISFYEDGMVIFEQV